MISSMSLSYHSIIIVSVKMELVLEKILNFYLGSFKYIRF